MEEHQGNIGGRDKAWDDVQLADSSTVAEPTVVPISNLPSPNVVRPPEAGFTLLEMLGVVMVMGTLYAIVSPKIMNTLSSTKYRVVHSQILSYASPLELFEMDVGRFPTSDEGLDAIYENPTGVDKWSGPYAKLGFSKADPWGHQWIYRSPSVRPGHRDYDLCSSGPDGKGDEPGDAEMICNP